MSTTPHNTFVITENDTKGFRNAMLEEMDKAIKHFEKELVKIRTGRAHTSLVEDLPVESYGQIMTMKSLAAIAAPDTRLITIQPWDVGVIGDIQKAILASDIGLTPVNDGKIIRLQLPEMSTTRRDELGKILGKKLTACKDAIKNIRKDFHNLMRDAKKNSTISEDFFNRLGDVLQSVTDEMCGKADQLAHKKEVEITTI